MVKKPRSIAFQRCIWRGGLHLVKISQNKDFLKKKLFFWQTRILISWLQSKPGPPILKVWTFLPCFLKNLGRNARNELWASLLASILSDWRPFEKFYQADTKKCKKTPSFAFRQINWDFVIATYIQGITIWNLKSWHFRKCVTQGGGGLYRLCYSPPRKKLLRHQR